MRLTIDPVLVERAEPRANVDDPGAHRAFSEKHTSRGKIATRRIAAVIRPRQTLAIEADRL